MLPPCPMLCKETRQTLPKLLHRYIYIYTHVYIHIYVLFFFFTKKTLLTLNIFNVLVVQHAQDWWYCFTLLCTHTYDSQSLWCDGKKQHRPQCTGDLPSDSDPGLHVSRQGHGPCHQPAPPCQASAAVTAWALEQQSADHREGTSDGALVRLRDFDESSQQRRQTGPPKIR